MEQKKNHHTFNTFIEAVHNIIEGIFEHRQLLPSNNILKSEKTITKEFSK